jgi:uncharacterized membrane protein
MHAEASITIDKPVEDVFAFTTDIEKLTKWSSVFKSVKRLSDGPVGIGTKDELTVEFVGQKIETTTEVTAYDPPNRYAYKSISGPLPFENTVLFTPAGTGTKVDLILEGEPEGLFKLAGPVFQPLAKKQLEDQLKTLKKVIEAQS